MKPLIILRSYKHMSLTARDDKGKSLCIDYRETTRTLTYEQARALCTALRTEQVTAFVHKWACLVSYAAMREWDKPKHERKAQYTIDDYQWPPEDEYIMPLTIESIGRVTIGPELKFLDLDGMIDIDFWALLHLVDFAHNSLTVAFFDLGQGGNNEEENTST